MSTVMSSVSAPPAPPVAPGRRRITVSGWTLAPTLFVLVNAIAFLLIRPDVNDLWAARARASAVSHGVGLFYWFSWFGGGSTPGNYSVITPYLSAWLGTEVVGAAAAVAAAALVTVVVRGTAHPRAAALVGAVGIAANLWSGRVPFLLGSAIGIGAVIALVLGRRALMLGLALLTVLASPVCGAFIAIGLSGTFLVTRTKGFRPIIAWAVGAMALSVGSVGLIFGAPGPEPFSWRLLLAVLGGLLVLLVARPPDHIRVTIYVSVLVCLALEIVPNGLGSNFARFGWFCLPVMVTALAPTRRRVLLMLGVLPALLIGVSATALDLYRADAPVSSPGYYTPLGHRLDQIPGLDRYRVEVVNHGAHAAYDALLPHASLARGWETQEDAALNAPLLENPLHPVTFKVWLDNNAVGYVALPAGSLGADNPEYTLVSEHRPAYLAPIWHDRHWTLFRVRKANRIVSAPARLIAHSQSSMTVQVPCACATSVRVRWSKFLVATAPGSVRPVAATVPTPPAPRPVAATVADDGSGWTILTTTAPGRYTFRGTVRGVLH